jgi:hypothetical protein
MYTYLCEKLDLADDIERMKSFGKYSLVTEISDADAHRITSFAAINSVQSVLALTATGDR